MTRPTARIRADKAVINIERSTTIVGDARLSSTAVWDALVDTSTWPRWNTLIPHVMIQQQATSGNNHNNSRPMGDHAGEGVSPILQLGTRMTFDVDVSGGTSPSSPSVEGNDRLQTDKTLYKANSIVTVFEPPDPATKKPGYIVWVGDDTAHGGFSPWVLRTERGHEIYDMKAGETDPDIQRVVITSWEYQAGLLSYVVRWMQSKKLRICFEVWLNNLKSFVERRLDEPEPAPGTGR